MFDLSKPNIPNSGLRAYFDAGIKGSYSGSGATWVDLAGTNDSSLIGSPVYSGGNGGFFTFNGSNYSTGTNPVTGTNTATLSAWIYPTTTGVFSCAVCTSFNGSETGLTIQQRNNGTYWLFCGVYGIVGEFVAPSYTVNQWVNFAVVINGTTLTGYKNGASAGSTGCTRTLTYNKLLIGKGADSSGGELLERFSGRIANVMIYNRALSAAEINQNFQVSRKRFGV